jgi:hypothetical protein
MCEDMKPLNFSKAKLYEATQREENPFAMLIGFRMKYRPTTQTARCT